MQLRKYEKLKIIYRGRVKTISCTFNKMLYNIVPIYSSDDVKDIDIIRFNTNDVVAIVNREFEKVHDTKEMDILIIYSLLAERMKNTDMVDIALAYWFGFNNIINKIKACKMGDNTESRISNLENELLHGKNSDVPDIRKVLMNIDYVTII